MGVSDLTKERRNTSKWKGDDEYHTVVFKISIQVFIGAHPSIYIPQGGLYQIHYIQRDSFSYGDIRARAMQSTATIAKDCSLLSEI
jgi:hypothetical protein